MPPGQEQHRARRAQQARRSTRHDDEHTEHGADYTLEVASGAILRLEVLQAEKLSHRKVFATAARKALKVLEKGPLK